MNQVLGAKAPKKQRTVADDAAEILEASHYQELFDRSIACTFGLRIIRTIALCLLKQSPLQMLLLLLMLVRMLK